jgi:ribonucleoside-triphosphate reductase
MPYFDEEFVLNTKVCDAIRKLTPQFGFNGFGEIVYYRTYSRIIHDEFDNPLGQESWADTVLRVIDGIFSIRKDWYVRNHIRWSESYWQQYAARMAHSLFRMEWLPPGRGLWSMGTDLIRQRGAMPLYNCAFTELADAWVDDLCWMMDALMNGVGVGFRPRRVGITLHPTQGQYPHVIPDTREGWVDSIHALLESFEYGKSQPCFDYSLIRPYGSPIKSFGGQASGPQPLMDLHNKIVELSINYMDDDNYDEVTFKTDIANLIGVCVVSGNVRRSAEIALCELDDPVFGELKNYKKFPERAAWGWMSNNSFVLEKDSDFESMGDIAYANASGHDVGYFNTQNVKAFGRIRHNRLWRENDVDHATGLNPCGEIPLEHREVCNLAETLPTRCEDTRRWLEACEFATFYTSTVSLLPTHQPSTNAIIARNRRIGISLIDFTGWKEQLGVCGVTAALRQGYHRIRVTNRHLAAEAGVPESIRVTTVKPGGTVPKIAGRQSGAGHPTFEHTLRRINVGIDTPIDRVLLDAGVPNELSVYTPNTRVFEYPIKQGPARPATEVSVWEQAMNVVLLQREWADNAVSNTLYFKPRWSLVRKYPDGAESIHVANNIFYSCSDLSKTEETQLKGHKIVFKDGEWSLYVFNENHEEDELEAVLSAIAPVTKSVSLLPHSDVGIFPQMPEEGITVAEYNKRLTKIKPIDWSNFGGSDGMDEKFCTGDTCTRI